MVKQKQNKNIPIADGVWKDLRVKKETAKRLMLFKIKQELLTYDQAITVLLDNIGEPQ